jgi:hypothetical protein
MPCARPSKSSTEDPARSGEPRFLASGHPAACRQCDTGSRFPFLHGRRECSSSLNGGVSTATAPALAMDHEQLRRGRHRRPSLAPKSVRERARIRSRGSRESAARTRTSYKGTARKGAAGSSGPSAQLARLGRPHARNPLPRLTPGRAPGAVPGAGPGRIRDVHDQKHHE